MYNTKNNIFRFYTTGGIHYGELLAFQEASTVTVLRNQIIGEKIKSIGTNDPLDYEYSTILQYTFMYNTKNNIFRFYATVGIHCGELLAFEEASTVTCTEKPNHW
jgi:hypothetical protein